MDSNNLLMYGLLAVLLNAIILYVVIKEAVYSAQRKHNIAIIKLLALIAQKNGADPTFVDDVVLESDTVFKNDKHFRK